MKAIKLFLSLFLPIMLLSGCYESKYPISGAKEQIKPELAGNWIGENFLTMKVIPISDTDYFILFSNKENDVTIGKAYSINMDNTGSLIVFQELSSGNNSYWFFKYTIQKLSNTYTLAIQSISNKFIKLNPPKDQNELKKIMTKNINNDAMFDTSQNFLKLVNTNLKLSLYVP